MDKHTCKLCFRHFHNGRALGGHMRSHVMAAAAYSPQHVQSPPLSSSSISSVHPDPDDKAEHHQLLSYVLRENPKKSHKLVEHELSGGCGGAVAGGESSVVQDGESDTESLRHGVRAAVSRRRSKRVRRRAPPATLDPEPASSVSDATPEEDVAMSLVMLSRDSWTRPRSKPEPHLARLNSDAEQNYADLVDEHVDDHDVVGDEYEDGYEAMAVGTARLRSRYQCGACKKVFRSYQALGGHRASLKKGKGGCLPPPLPPLLAKTHSTDATPAAPIVHECPFCFRVFDSGQALGGHKRAHMSSAVAVASSSSHAALAPPCTISSQSPVKCGDSFGFIDLNLPAATEDDFELSAVYDTEFGNNRP